MSDPHEIREGLVVSPCKHGERAVLVREHRATSVTTPRGCCSGPWLLNDIEAAEAWNKRRKLQDDFGAPPQASWVEAELCLVSEEEAEREKPLDVYFFLNLWFNPDSAHIWYVGVPGKVRPLKDLIPAARVVRVAAVRSPMR